MAFPAEVAHLLKHIGRIAARETGELDLILSRIEIGAVDARSFEARLRDEALARKAEGPGPALERDDQAIADLAAAVLAREESLSFFLHEILEDGRVAWLT